MNKKEQAAFEELQTRLALRFTGFEPIKPDIPVPSCFQEMTKGFLFNSYSKRVEPACSTTVSHGYGRDDRTSSQNARALYSSRKLALMAMRREVEIMYAKELRQIDKQIEAEESGSAT